MRPVGSNTKARERFRRRRTPSQAQGCSHQVPVGRDGVDLRAARPAVSRLRGAGDHLTAPRLSAAAAGLFLVVYAVFVGTPAGRGLDAVVVRHDLEGWPDRLAEHLTALISPPTLALAVIVLMWVAYRCGRPADGIRAAVLVPAAGALAQALEAVLGDLDPLRGETARQLGAWFYPSGHSAIAMSLSLAALLVAPARSRSVVMLWGGIWASVSGWLIYAEGSHHHPSDVLGGFLIALALAGLAAVRRPARDQGAPPRRGLPTTRIAAALGAIAGASLVLMPAWLLSVPLGPLQPPLLLSGALVSAAAFLIVSIYEHVLDRPP
jgi:membrane-associated phospholipid phosphatase